MDDAAAKREARRQKILAQGQGRLQAITGSVQTSTSIKLPTTSPVVASSQPVPRDLTTTSSAPFSGTSSNHTSESIIIKERSDITATDEIAVMQRRVTDVSVQPSGPALSSTRTRIEAVEDDDNINILKSAAAKTIISKPTESSFPSKKIDSLDNSLFIRVLSLFWFIEFFIVIFVSSLVLQVNIPVLSSLQEWSTDVSEGFLFLHYSRNFFELPFMQQLSTDLGLMFSSFLMSEITLLIFRWSLGKFFEQQNQTASIAQVLVADLASRGLSTTVTFLKQNAEFKKRHKKGTVKCDQCDGFDTPPIGSIWLCLSADGCNSLACGRAIEAHSMRHHEGLKSLDSSPENHALCMNIDSGEIWCYACDDYVPVECFDETKLKQEYLIIMGIIEKRRSASRSSSKSPTSKQGSSILPLGSVGLANLGNTCYMNAAFQVLLQCAPIAKYLDTCDAIYQTKSNSRLTAAFSTFVKAAWSGDVIHIAPSILVREIKLLNPMFQGFGQHDSQELLRFVLDRLNDELREEDVTPKDKAEGGMKRYRSIITDVFEGILESRVKCLNCGKDSFKDDSFYDLSVPLKSTSKSDQSEENELNDNQSLFSYLLNSVASAMTALVTKHLKLEQCLETFSLTETLTQSNQFRCDHCKTLSDCEKTLSVVKLPEILTIHLKRFRHDSYFSSKIGTKVSFPLQDLNMLPFCKIRGKNNLGIHMYNLFAVINHRGSLGGGHYVAYTKSLSNDMWYEFDDGYVTQKSESEIARLEAYVLVYQKKKENYEDLVQFQAMPGDDQDTGNEYLFVPRYWLHLWQTCANPGPICNRDVSCEHGYVDPSLVGRIESLVDRISSSVYSRLVASFGTDGYPCLSSLKACDECTRIVDALDNRRELEKQYVIANDSTQLPDGEVWYMMNTNWLSQWHLFINKRLKNPPGPISNDQLVDKNGKPVPNLTRGRHYNGVNVKIWRFFQERYGGGPVISREIIDIYSPSVNK